MSVPDGCRSSSLAATPDAPTDRASTVASPSATGNGGNSAALIPCMLVLWIPQLTLSTWLAVSNSIVHGASESDDTYSLSNRDGTVVRPSSTTVAATVVAI